MASAWTRAPPLNGYVRFQARPTSDTILMADRKDPLLVRWQYGLGRAGVFTSDAKNRWAANWVTWPGFDQLWANIFRDLLPHAAGRARPPPISTAPATNWWSITASPRDVEEPAHGPRHFRLRAERIPGAAESGQGRGRPLSRAARASGRQPGAVPRSSAGRYRAPFPRWASTGRRTRLQEYGNNQQLLRQIAAATGGRYNPRPADVFEAAGRSIATVMDLWPGLLALALSAEPGGVDPAEVEGPAGGAAPAPRGIAVGQTVGFRRLSSGPAIDGDHPPYLPSLRYSAAIHSGSSGSPLLGIPR